MTRPLVLFAVLPLALLVGLSVVLIGDDCQDGAVANAGALSRDAERAIPPGVAEIYVAMARRWNIDVAFLASIGAQETDHGRIPTTNEVNASGCQGLMQLGVGGACGDYWDRNKCDGDGDGRLLVTDFWDNVCAAARGLRREKGAPPAGGAEAAYRRAACNYYGACADGVANYADEVMARAELYGFVGGSATNPGGLPVVGQAVGGCEGVAIAAGDGEFVVEAGANRPGADLAPELVGFVRRMAEILPRPPVVTTGTNHSPTTTSGGPSDHWTGHAADFGSARNGFPVSGGGYGDEIAFAAFLAAGEPVANARAKAQRGGLFTIRRGALRIQIIWKTLDGGNHYHHVHVGVRNGALPGAVDGPAAPALKARARDRERLRR
jgi:hypothetical protein